MAMSGITQVRGRLQGSTKYYQNQPKGQGNRGKDTQSVTKVHEMIQSSMNQCKDVQRGSKRVKDMRMIWGQSTMIESGIERDTQNVDKDDRQQMIVSRTMTIFEEVCDNLQTQLKMKDLDSRAGLFNQTIYER